MNRASASAPRRLLKRFPEVRSDRAMASSRVGKAWIAVYNPDNSAEGANTLDDSQPLDPETPPRSPEGNVTPAPAGSGAESPTLTSYQTSSHAPGQVHSNSDPIPGLLLHGRYQIERELGRGGVGVVYLARDLQLLSRPVVVKVLLGQSYQSEWLRRRFRQEIEALARIEHPGVVGVLDMGDLPDGKPFFVMQYIDGQSLRARMNAGPLQLLHLSRLVRQIGSALGAAHDRGVFHRDIKPENIMLQPLPGGEDQVKLIDFGLARVLEAKSTSGPSEVMVAGTLHYMAPEQLMAEEPSALTDIYALGVLVFELVGGRPPYESPSPLRLLDLQWEGPQTRLRDLRPELSPEAEQVVLKALSFSPEDRYPDPWSFAEAFTQALFPENIPPPAPGSGLPSASEPGRTEHTFVKPPVTAPAAVTAPPNLAGLRVMLVHRRYTSPDERLAHFLERHLTAHGAEVAMDRHPVAGIAWAREISQQIREAQVVVPLISEASVSSEMVTYELQTAREEARRGGGTPRLLPMRLCYDGKLPAALAGGTLAPDLVWNGPDDDIRVAQALVELLAVPSGPPSVSRPHLESTGGAVPLDSAMYIERPTDEVFCAAISRQDSIVLVKGARQTGKTSLLARGLQQARQQAATVVVTDFQKLSESYLESLEGLLPVLAESMLDQLDLEVSLERTWSPRLGAAMNFDRFLRRVVLNAVEGALVWGLDEVDRLFARPYASEFFGLFRSWHNDRSLNPGGPWKKLTLAMAFASEAHLFITDVHQSPFNVGTRLVLEDFTAEQVAELNQRMGSPLSRRDHLTRFIGLVGGQPYLVRRGLQQLLSAGTGIDGLEATADQDDGPFGDHLRRILMLLARDPSLGQLARTALMTGKCATPEIFYRLRSAGLILGDVPQKVSPRCGLYATYLSRCLR